MNGKNKVFRYLIWFLYTLLTGTLLSGLVSVFCVREGLAAYWGVLIAALYSAAAGVCVFLMNRAELGSSFATGKYRILLRVLEAAAAIVFLGVGLRLRIEGVDSAKEWMIYYEIIQAAEGGDIPRMAHGAVYAYLRLLQFVLNFFGNQFAAGIWLQILLQTAALLGLYFVVRQTAGVTAALVMLAFSMCTPYMVQNSLLLSPEMLYFCLLTAVTVLTAKCGRRLRPPLFLLIGILTGLCTYLDVMGVLLFIPAAAVIFRRREEDAEKEAAAKEAGAAETAEVRKGTEAAEIGGITKGAGDVEIAGTLKKTRSVKKTAAVLLWLAGACLGFWACVFWNAAFGGESVREAVQGWLMLYQPDSFQVPAVMSGACSELEGIVLLGLMIFGVFSFWCNPQKERISLWMLAVMSVMLAACFDIFTNEMPGYFYLYVLFVVLAGIGVGQCFYGGPPETEDAAVRGQVEKLPKDEGKGPQFPENGPEGAGNRQEASSAGPRGAGNSQEASSDGPRGAGNRQEASSDGPGAGLNRENPMAAGPDSAKMRGNGLERLGAGSGDMKEIGWKEPAEDKNSERQMNFIENPLPLPKKHVKRVMDYSLESASAKEDFDHPTASDDDFDI